MSVTRAWKVYGKEGHRQRESFSPSYKHDWIDGDNVRIIEVDNSDKTGTNEYSIIRITRNTALECERELEEQMFEGIFENSHVGYIEEMRFRVELHYWVNGSGFSCCETFDNFYEYCTAKEYVENLDCETKDFILADYDAVKLVICDDDFELDSIWIRR
jgi:hypothetical protein